MHSLFVIAAIGVFLGVVVFWTLAMVAALRSFGTNVPFSLGFRFYRRNEPELLNSLRSRSINVYVAISGLLLFACPLFAGLTAYDYVVRHWVEHSTYGLNGAVGSVVALLVLGIAGVWVSLNDWQKSTESGIGLAVLVVLVLKVSTDTMGAFYALAFLVPAVLCCSLVYFGIRRIRYAFAGTGRRYPKRRDMGATTNFIAEQFVPSERYKAQQVDIAREVAAAGLNPEQIASPFFAPVLSSGEKPKNDKKRKP